MSAPSVPPRRNPGPSWGYSFLRAADSVRPRFLFRTGLAVGTAVAFLFMHEQRRNAAEYWRALTGKQPTWAQLWRQFFAFAESLMELLRLGPNGQHRFDIREGEEGDAFKNLASSQRPALFGTFHVGNSDLLGYALSYFNRRVHMIRTRVENSAETDWLQERFSGSVTFIWVDRPEAMLFAIKDAIASGHSLAMKCDRLEQSSKQEAFWFLGKYRLFPFAIYYFSLLFDLPVVFATAWPREPGRSEVSASAVFEPDPASDRKRNLERAREHFQGVLRDLETRLRREPALWFNFIPLNPEAPSQSAPMVSVR